jgi:hypothetical protein
MDISFPLRETIANSMELRLHENLTSHIRNSEILQFNPIIFLVICPHTFHKSNYFENQIY